MPEVACVIVAFVCLYLVIIFAYERYSIPDSLAESWVKKWANKLSVYFVIMTLALLSWVIVAHMYCETQETEYEITTITRGPGNIKQVAVVDEKMIDVTASTGRYVNEKVCRLLVTSYDTFSYGMWIMVGVNDEYSIVCYPLRGQQ